MGPGPGHPSSVYLIRSDDHAHGTVRSPHLCQKDAVADAGAAVDLLRLGDHLSCNPGHQHAGH